jgi:hypothetical protein
MVSSIVKWWSTLPCGDDVRFAQVMIMDDDGDDEKMQSFRDDEKMQSFWHNMECCGPNIL